MSRNYGTTTNGFGFPEQMVSAVWSKGQIVPGYDPAVYRKDVYGSWMKREDHGNIYSQYGWEIDHIIPIARGGTDNISNLQPLYWRNNRSKSDN